MDRGDHMTYPYRHNETGHIVHILDVYYDKKGSVIVFTDSDGERYAQEKREFNANFTLSLS